MTTMSNLNPSYIELELGLGFDNMAENQLFHFITKKYKLGLGCAVLGDLPTLNL